MERFHTRDLACQAWYTWTHNQCSSQRCWALLHCYSLSPGLTKKTTLTFHALSASINISECRVLEQNSWLCSPCSRYPDADILTSSDQLKPTVKTEDLERWPEAGSAFNIGIMMFRPTSQAFVGGWCMLLMCLRLNQSPLEYLPLSIVIAYSYHTCVLPAFCTMAFPPSWALLNITWQNMYSVPLWLQARCLMHFTVHLRQNRDS
jgi:hypothetical protein